MQKQPFTQAGFVALQTELYLLNDTLLQLEADEIALNFKGWMNDHFELSSNQTEFMNQLNPKAVSFLSSQTSFAVANRLPITLAKEEEEEEEKIGKVIKPKSNFTVTADASGNMVAEGDLLIQIYYLT